MIHADPAGPAASAAPADLLAALIARASVLVCALHLVPGSGATAQEPGTLLPDVTSDHDPARGYALYIPSRYDPARPAPVLFVMDPRGRAREALELFRAGAERHGWIVISSRDTRSDTPVDPNELALEAMLQDAQARFAVHERRLYVAGFSGTARAAWEFAKRIPEHTGGVIGFGAAPAPLRLAASPELPLYLGVGRLDFNFHEVRGIGRLLDRLEDGPPHRVVYFPGTHGWGPPSMAAEAIDWMELQAMHRGLRPLDAAWLRTYRDGQLARGEALEASDRPEEALALYRALARDLSGLVDADEVRARVRRLEDAGEAAARERRLDELAERAGVLRVRLEDAVTRLRSEESLPQTAELRSFLKIDSLRAEAAEAGARDGEADAAGGHGAGPAQRTERGADPGAEEAARVLETVHVRLSFYVPRDLLAGDSPRAALVALGLAETAKPGTARVCRFWALALARIVAKEERTRETPDLLRCAAERGGGSDDPSPAPVGGPATRTVPRCRARIEFIDPPLRARLNALLRDGRTLWERFDRQVRSRAWHPFVPADYEAVLRDLLPHRRPGRRFLEMGSATGVITVMADLLGFEAFGIEIDPDLVARARSLARRHGSCARFAVGSYLPSGYAWKSGTGDDRLGAIATGEAAYPELGHELSDFDVVFAYPWYGDAPVLQDLMTRRGGANATLLLHDHPPRVA